MSETTTNQEHISPDPVEVYRRGDALLAVDVQKDFCPGGALAIDEGDRILPVLNRWRIGQISPPI